jgi:hypothetical protein
MENTTRNNMAVPWEDQAEILATRWMGASQLKEAGEWEPPFSGAIF